MFVAIGHVRHAHGIKGEVFVRVPSGETSWLEDLETARIGGQDYKIEAARRHKDGIIFKLDGVNDRNESEKFKGREMVIPEKFLVAPEGETPFLREILGFEVEDLNLGSVGSIIEFATNGPQDLLVVKYKGREQFIPFVKPFVLEMDFAGRRIKMDLPQGLLE